MLQKIPELRPGRDGEQAWGFGVGGGVPKGGARTRLTFDPGRSKGEGGGPRVGRAQACRPLGADRGREPSAVARATHSHLPTKSVPRPTSFSSLPSAPISSL